MIKTTTLLSLCVLTCSANALAQDAAEQVSAEPEIAQVNPRVAQQLKQLEALIAAQQKRLEVLEKSGEAATERAASLQTQVQAAEEERQDLMMQVMEAQNDTDAKTFEIFGFMDSSFAYYAAGENDLVKTFVIPESTFVTSNVNLYFKSQLTSKLSTLIETRFTFQPNGEETLPTQAYIGDTPLPLSGSYIREDTTVTDPLTAASFQLGGVMIERAHIDYKAFEWLGIRLGRWLTPYGIWNVDHGSPVLLGTSLPQLVSTQQVPNNQTGIQLFGRIFPSDIARLDYALTLSNGRGPTSNVYDLDSNKALGLRAKLYLRLGDFKAEAGVYGYYGKYTDAMRQIEIRASPDLTVDFDAETPIGSRIVTTSEYDELVMLADFSVSGYGFRLFGEGVWRRVDYKVRPSQDATIYLVEGGTLGGSALAPNFISKGGYLMLSYDVPADFIQEGVFFRPYVGIEHIAQNDATDAFNYTLYRMGLNMHPNPFMVWKFHAINFQPVRKDVFGTFWGLTTQVAVSF